MRSEEELVGLRVSSGGERATVRYAGTVGDTPGVWLGVEWDDPVRGKHDGSHEGVRYFTVRHHSSGSFIRPHSVSFGVDYVTALGGRYGSELEQLEVSSRSLKILGFKHLRLDSLTDVCLRSSEVSGPGPQHQIRQTTPLAVSLDLSGNLLSSWELVSSITEQLEHLEQLQLSENRLSLPLDPSGLSPAFSRLRTLSLNSCALTWPQVLRCAPMWPHLEELILSDNDITDLCRPDPSLLEKLKVLDLFGNALIEETVMELSSLPRLERLNLSSTGLSDLHIRADTHTPPFPALQTLLLDDNNITQWSVVDSLDQLEVLVQLSCRRNPLIQRGKSPETVRQILIARLGRLELLNMTPVTSEERRWAELDYCKMFGWAWLQAGGHSDLEKDRPSAEFLATHPRFPQLIRKHGAPDEAELKEQKPFSLREQLLAVTFAFPDDSGRAPLEKKLPGSMMVQKVKGLLLRLLKRPGVQLRLSYTCPKTAQLEVQMDNDLKPLTFYSLQQGDTVLVRWA